LKRYAGFANNIGEGKLDTSFVKLSEEDSIGSSLLNMRDNLAQLSEEDRKRNWINEGVAKFSELLRSEDDCEDFHFQLISHLVKYLEANQGSLYILNNDKQDQPFMQLEGAYAWGKRKYDENKVKFGEGLIGQVWREKDVLFLTEVPDDYITITSGLGKANPTCLLIAPMVYNNEVMGIIEIASFRPLNKHEIELVERVSESIATTVSRLKTTNRTRYLYEQSQMQAEELRAQEEEMRQNNEELQAIQEEMRRKEQEYIDRIGELEKDNSDKGAEAKELQRKIEILEKMVMESEYTSEMVSAKKKSGKKKASQE